MAQRIPAIRQKRPLIAIKIRRVTARQPEDVQCKRAVYTVRGKLRIHAGCTEKNWTSKYDCFQQWKKTTQRVIKVHLSTSKLHYSQKIFHRIWWYTGSMDSISLVQEPQVNTCST